MNAVRILKSKIHGLQESNPMLGLRGCRLGIRHPGEHLPPLQRKLYAVAGGLACRQLGWRAGSKAGWRQDARCRRQDCKTALHRQP
jgi:hypothetical protein